MKVAPPTPAAEPVKRYLRAVARQLGVADPVAILGDATFDRAFSAPAGDPYHGANGLVPHYLPLELSFRESSAGELRFALELLGPGALPAVRRDATTALFRSLVKERPGAAQLAWFDERAAPWRREPLPEGSGRGAFLGALIGRHGLGAAKIYYRLDGAGLDRLPAALGELVRTTLALVPAEPRGVAFNCGPEGGAIQAYLELRRDLAPAGLEPLTRALGLAEESAELRAAVDSLRGGGEVLPAGSLFLELRELPRGAELQLDLMMGALERPPARPDARVRRMLAERPGAGAAWDRWLAAVGLGRHPAGNVTSLALRVAAGSPLALSVYLVPAMARLRPPRAASEVTAGTAPASGAVSAAGGLPEI